MDKKKGHVLLEGRGQRAGRRLRISSSH
jgi:hypothetical protein